MLSACTRVHSRAHAGGGLPPALFRSRSKSGCFTSPRMNTKSASSAAANPPADPLMDKTDALRMLKFINYAWTPYHVVEAVSKKLLAAGYTHLSERQEWDIKAGGKYFFTRNMSSVVAFAVGKKYEPCNGIYMVGAHTDSPCLKVKPISKGTKSGFDMVNVETYGGGLFGTWFDRDLSVAGRVLVRGTAGKLEHKLVKIEKPILRIPMLAIHLNRDIDKGFKFNKQTELCPILATAVKSQLEAPSPMGTVPSPPQGTGNSQAPEGGPQVKSSHHPMLLEALAIELGCSAEDIVDMELNICDTQDGTIGGVRDEFINVGRLDNQAMCWCSIQALIDSTEAEGSLDNETAVRAVALFDHEEVGSSSAVGAGGTLMRDAIIRVSSALADGRVDATERCLQNSFLVSADMAHGLHPNYADRHEPDHQPKFHQGLVIKYNQNQRYATNSVTATLFKQVAVAHGLPCQAFVVRNDMPCGSTIGPILSSGLGVRTIDVGISQFAMHSIREMCGTVDVRIARQHFKAFFEDFARIDATIDVDACMVEPDGLIDDVPCDCLVKNEQNGS